jgi:5'-3' exonuclease
MSLMLIDSASLWYRAYYGMPETLTSPHGEPINAVRGFIDMTARLISQYRPERFALCLDGDWRPSWRVELFPEYKQNRITEDGQEEEPDLLSPQIPIILDFFDLLGIESIGVDDFEADDVIASLSRREKGPTRIVTGDRDLFQLVDQQKDVKIVYLAKGIGNHDLVDIQWIANKYSIPGDRYDLFAMIRGDASDGLPGIKGIGEKGAVEIAKVFGSMAEVISAALTGDSRLQPKHTKRILADLHYAQIAEKLVRCKSDIDLPHLSFRLEKKYEMSTQLKQYKEDYGLGASVDRLIAALSQN